MLLIKALRKKSTPFLFIFIFFCLTGCDTKFYFPEVPAPIPVCPAPENIRIALILGGGGTKGMAHVGVLEELEQVGIPIDIIVGCSAGSIVGALYADCPKASCVRKMLDPLRIWDILDMNLSRSRYGFVQGGSLRRFLKKNLRSTYFEQLSIPLYVVATDLLLGELVCFNSGPIIPAVHASAAVPFVFSPVILHERFLVDGGVADPVPVQVAAKLNAELIIAVDLSQLLVRTCPNNLFTVASRAAEIKFLLQSESCVNGAHVVIRPELGGMGMFDDKDLEKVYAAGKAAGKAAIPQILKMIQEKNIPIVPPCLKIEAASD